MEPKRPSMLECISSSLDLISSTEARFSLMCLERRSVLNKIWAFMPVQVGESTEAAVSVFEAGVLPPTREYFRYNGSLTTPPCSEGVRWIVLQEHLTASAEQIAAFKARIGEASNRPVQPDYARLIVK